jgi:hypothetical protein
LHDLSPYPRSLSAYSRPTDEVVAGDVEGEDLGNLTNARTVALLSAIAKFARASKGQKLRILGASDDCADITSGTRREAG